MNSRPSSRPVRLAVFFDQVIAAGGGYQQALNALALIRALPTDLCDPYFVVVHPESRAALKDYGVDAICLPLARWQRALVGFRGRLKSRRLTSWLNALIGDNGLDGFFKRQSTDLIYFTSPSDYAMMTDRFNYIFTVWDMCHRDHVEFPEIRRNREFERRERLYGSAISKSVATLVDSELARTNLVQRYGIDADRVHVFSFEPAPGIVNGSIEKNTSPLTDVKKRFQLDVDYVFYPAQFWAHKNHVYLLKGLKLLEERYGLRLGAIFAGGDAGGNRKYIEAVTQELHLTSRVRFAGFVPNEALRSLYRESVALVMPTYFGPTNLPPLEAFVLGVPVLYSDLPGLRDQVGDAALLVDLTRPESLAEQLNLLLSKAGLREQLIDRGRRLMALNSAEKRSAKLGLLLEGFRHKRDCWAQE